MDFAGQLSAAEFRYSSYSYCTVLLLYKTTLSRSSLGTHAGCQHHNSHEICTRSAHEICTISSARRSVITPCPWSMDHLHACYTHHPHHVHPVPKTRGDAILAPAYLWLAGVSHVSIHPRMYVCRICLCAFQSHVTHVHVAFLPDVAFDRRPSTVRGVRVSASPISEQLN